MPTDARAHDALDTVVEAVLASAKYRDLTPDLVAAVAAVELGKGRSRKDAIKATKNKLHQVFAAYHAAPFDYAGWLKRLSAAASEPESLRAACRAILASHASTRERLPILDEFYMTLFTDLPPFASLADLACGLNPLTIPWMGLPPGVTYTACDVGRSQVVFLDACIKLLGMEGRAETCDLVHAPPVIRADVVLLLKTIPCLEQIDKEAGRRLLEQIEAKALFVSFPAQSLGGRSKGMAAHYSAHFADLIDGLPYTVQEFSFPGEIVFRLQRISPP